jgi:hypothetical protein
MTIRELTDSELDLASGGASNDVVTFVAQVSLVTAIALDGLGKAAHPFSSGIDGDLCKRHSCPL